MKTYAIADLHGRKDLLVDALQTIYEDGGDEPGRIITLGDYVDRGPDGKGVIDMLMAGPKSGWSMICLKGNHESMMVETAMAPLEPQWWVGHGGRETLMSYGHPELSRHPDKVSMSYIPMEHLAWAHRRPLSYVDRHRIYVHAGMDLTRPVDEQTEETMLWMRWPEGFQGFEGIGDRHIVHGHTPYRDGPKLLSGRTNLDTLAWRTGRLVIGVFDDDVPGGPIKLYSIKGPAA